MFTLQMIQEQIKNNQPNLMLVFPHKTRVAARFLCDLFITRTAHRARHNVERVTGKFIHAYAQRITMIFRKVAVDF